MQTTVLGTSFKINAFQGKLLNVAVTTGKVRVARQVSGTDSVQSLAVLTPGVQVSWDPGTGASRVSRADAAAVLGWKDGTTTYVAASLADIAKDLEQLV